MGMWDWEKETARMYTYGTYSVFFCIPLSFMGLSDLGGYIFHDPLLTMCEREGWCVAEDTVQPLNLARHKKERDHRGCKFSLQLGSSFSGCAHPSEKHGQHKVPQITCGKHELSFENLGLIIRNFGGKKKS